MKKILFYFLILILSLGVVACGVGTGVTSTQNSNVENTSSLEISTQTSQTDSSNFSDLISSESASEILSTTKNSQEASSENVSSDFSGLNTSTSDSLLESTSVSSTIGESSTLSSQSSLISSSINPTISESSQVLSSSSLILSNSSSVLSSFSSNTSVSSSVVTSYAIIVNQSVGGTVTASANQAKVNDRITLSNSADLGYAFVSYNVTCNGDEIEVIDGQFLMPEGNVTVTATWQANEYELTILHKYGSKVLKTTRQAVKYTESVTVQAESIEGYTAKQTSKTFTMDTVGGKTVSYEYEINSYTVTVVQPSEGGTIVVGGRVESFKVNYGTRVALIVGETETGYYLSSWNVKQGQDEVVVTNNGFAMPAGDVTVTASFSKSGYAINIASGIIGGEISANKVRANYGDEITLSNIPNAGYSFTSYTVKQGNVNVEVTDGKFIMPAGEVTISGTFTLNNYTLTVNYKYGSTILKTETFSVAYNSSKTVTAPTIVGYTPSSATKSFTMDTVGGKTVTYDYSINSYKITVTQPSVGGSITAGGKTGTITVNYGTSVTLVNTPTSGYQFSSWSVTQGNTAVTVSNNKFTMPAGDVTVTASFVKSAYTITVTQATGGTIKSSTNSANAGDLITLTKTATSGYSFGSWTVKQGSTAITVTGDKFTMPAGNVTVTASWKPIEYTLTVNYKYGSTTLKTETFSVAYKSSKTVTGPSITGYTPSSATKSFTMDTVGGKTVTYDYTINSYTITVTQPSAGGSITAGGKTGTVTVNYGSSVSLASSPATGYQFSSWTVKQGSSAVSVSSNKFTMPAGNVTVTASFSKISYTITVTQVTGGTIKAKNLTSNITATYGESVALTNTPSTGYKFGSYSVKNGSTAVSVSNNAFTMPAGNVTVTGTFSKISYTITVTQVTGGTISTSKATANYGDNITLSNTPSTGYKFGSYSVKNGSTAVSVSNNAFTMPAGNVTVTGTFSKISYTITVTQVTGGTINVSKTTANYQDSITLSNTPSTGYKFGSYSVKNGSTAVSVSNNAFTMPAGNVTVTGTFSKISYTITVTQVTGGTINVSKTTANYQDSITLSNTPTAGYVFSSYTVKQGSTAISVSSSKFTMPAGNVTVTGSFVKGIGGLANSNFTNKMNNSYGATISGSLTINGNKASSTQDRFPFVYTEAAGNFYYEVKVAVNGSKIYNSDLYPKTGIAIQVDNEVIFAPIDALANGWDNGGFGNNTWLILGEGAGSLSSGTNWSFDTAGYSGNFNLNYSSSSTYITLGVLRVDGVFKFFANDKYMYSAWYPSMTGRAQVGVLSFNLAFEAKDAKIGTGNNVINNVNAYYGINSSKNPTTVNVDGVLNDWNENLVNHYGATDGTRYFYASAFKGSNAVYVTYKAKSSNLITNAADWFANTNIEMLTGSNNTQIYATASGLKGNVDQLIFTSKQDGLGMYRHTVELSIPYSVWGGTGSSTNVKLGFAFRTEEIGYNMCEGADNVWWCGLNHPYFDDQRLTVTTTGLNNPKETTPTDKVIKTSMVCADPFVMLDGGKYYLYGTTAASNGYKVYVSEDLQTWRAPTSSDFAAVGVTPNTEQSSGYCFHINWSKPVGSKAFWASEVKYNPNTKKYVMYYAATKVLDGVDYPKSGVATSSTPLGPFIDVNSGTPMIYANENKSSIDATCFVDTDGQAYMFYSLDCSHNVIENYYNGMACHVSQTWGVKLDSTWTKISGDPVLISTPDQDWEFADGGDYFWNEGPFVYKYNRKYYLTYSANGYGGVNYGVGLAISTSPLGTYHKYKGNPIVAKQEGKTVGTGHGMCFTDKNGKLWYTFHTYQDLENVAYNKPRVALFARAWFDNGILKIEYKNW